MSLYLREVEPKDIDLLYEWANDPEVRNSSFNTEQIPYDTHRQWFIKILADRDTLLYILCDSDRKEKPEVGQIRLAIENDTAVISYTIASEMRGKGLGSKMILMAEEKLRENEIRVNYCVGQVKYDNPASARVFEKCGYDCDEYKEYMEFTKRIRG